MDGNLGIWLIKTVLVQGRTNLDSRRLHRRVENKQSATLDAGVQFSTSMSVSQSVCSGDQSQERSGTGMVKTLVIALGLPGGLCCKHLKGAPQVDDRGTISNTF